MNTRLIARFLSFIFIPLFAPTVLLAFVSFTDPVLVYTLPLLYKMSFIGLTFAITALLPLAAILSAHRAGYISDPEMVQSKDRLIPQLITIAVYFGFALMLSFKLQPDTSLSRTMWASLFTVVIISFITPGFKISAHSAGAAGTAGLILGYAYRFQPEGISSVAVLALLLMGAVMWARLRLHVHTPAQVWTGCLLGLLTGFATGMWVY